MTAEELQRSNYQMLWTLALEALARGDIAGAQEILELRLKAAAVLRAAGLL